VTLIASSEVSARDCVADCLRRIHASQSTLNAFIAIDDARAMEHAEAADRMRAVGGRLGPLHGMPIAIKDMFDRAGRRPGCGADRGGGDTTRRDATIVERLERAGAIIVGALHMTEYALGLTGHNDHLGDCTNPWSPAHVTGGSSSGPAAVVGARLLPAAIGSDTGASIRIPAAWCGAVGIKPTHGRVSGAGAMAMSYSLDTIGPLASDMRGCALMLGVIAGADPRDPHAAAVPVPDYAAALGGDLRRLRVGVIDEYFGDGLDPGVEAALGEAVRVLRACGAAIVEVKALHADLARRLHRLVMAAEAAAIHARMLEDSPERFTAEVRYRLELGRRLPAKDYLAALRGRAQLLREFVASSFARADVLLTALVPRPAPARDRTRFGAPGFEPALLADIPKRTQPFNYLGLPALAVPCGFVADRPIGFQLVGRPFDEATLF
jgi:aspartyl-tRNA(Asn)/glutamyl-tRNA(Gln) amidotransferase subunit A